MSQSALALAASQIDLKPIAGWFIARLSKIVQSIRDDSTATDPQTYSLYFRNCFEWASQATSLAFPKGPVPLQRFWVPLSLETPDGNEIPAKLLAIQHESALIVGTGGSGKTTILRSLYLEAFPTETENTHTTPFIFHLSRFDPKHKSIPEFMCEQLKSDGINLAPESLFRYLNARAAIVFFDGFDEIAPAHREHFRELLLQMRRSLHAPLRTIITTRDTGDLEKWDPIHRYNVKPMSFDIATQLIEKIGAEVLGSEIFASFRYRWTPATFSSAYGFADNPLLLTLMIMVFEDGKELEPLAIDFPDDVFNTMWRRHRAHGAGEGRQRRTTMPKLSFRDVLDRFALIGYTRDQIVWNEDGVMRLARESLELQGMNGEEYENFIIDLVEVVCMMTKDGDEYRFSHRSLQEFFAASKIAKSAHIGEFRSKLLRDPADNIPKILCILVRDRVVHDIIFPALCDIYGSLDQDDDSLRDAVWTTYLSQLTSVSISSQQSSIGFYAAPPIALFQLCERCSDLPPIQKKFVSLQSHYDSILKALGLSIPEDRTTLVELPIKWVQTRPPEIVALVDSFLYGDLSETVSHILHLRKTYLNK